LPAGQPVAGGAGARLMTAVGTEVAVPVPSLFLAVTRTRNVFPASTFRSVYVLDVAPPTFEQLPPSSSQRRHW
jgi:hypothetical protein